MPEPRLGHTALHHTPWYTVGETAWKPRELSPALPFLLLHMEHKKAAAVFQGTIPTGNKIVT